MGMPHKFFKKPRGFSLVELMVVVSIIAVLSAIAIPKFRIFQAKARQAEAKMNLSTIFTLESSYQGDNDTFVNLPAVGFGYGNPNNTLGFYTTGVPRYTYTVGSASTIYFLGDAKSGTGTSNMVMPGCASADDWQMDSNETLSAVNDAVANFANCSISTY